MTFELGDFDDLTKYENKFDAAFAANLYAYFEDASAPLKQFKQCVKPGGIIISRHFDNTFWLAFPIAPELTSKVLHWGCKAGNVQPSGEFFNNSSGQSLLQAYRNAGLTDVHMESTTSDLTGPLTEDQKNYLKVTAKFAADVACRVGDEDAIDHWMSHFEPGNPNYVLDRDDCVFTLLDYTITGRVEK